MWNYLRMSDTSSFSHQSLCIYRSKSVLIISCLSQYTVDNTLNVISNSYLQFSDIKKKYIGQSLTVLTLLNKKNNHTE